MKCIYLPTILMIIFLAASCSSGKEAGATVAAPAPELTEQPSSPPSGAPRGPRQQDPERKAKYDAMLASLNLTEKQLEDFEFINQKYRAQMQQLRQNAGEDRMAMRTQMQELRSRQNAELKEILNEEQFATYEKWRQENRSRGRRDTGPGN